MVHATLADGHGVPEQRKQHRASPRPRIQGNIAVEGEGALSAPCEVSDLSHSGIRVTTADPLAPGRAVCIQLRLPEGRITLVGETVWVRPAGLSRFEVGCWHVPDGAESRERLELLLGG